MTYEYHVFLSYRRYGRWPRWTKEIFVPIFVHWLGEELGENIEIFFDQDIETGVAWPQKLARALANSRILVPLWSRQYFNSIWCMSELAHMRAREQQHGFRKGSQLGELGLIVPATIHDGDDLPHDIQELKPKRLEKYSNAFAVEGSRTIEELSEAIRDWVPDIAKAIRKAPPYNLSWMNLSREEFMKLFESRQNTPPSLGMP